MTFMEYFVNHIRTVLNVIEIQSYPSCSFCICAETFSVKLFSQLL